MPLVSVTAADIDTAGLPVEAELPVPWLDGELADADAKAQAPGTVTARLSRSGGDDILVRGRAKASITVPCARCLDPTPIDVDGELALLLKPKPVENPKAKRANGAKKKAHDEPEEYEFTSEEAEFDEYDGETVVLDPFIREAILLELPNFPLCSEACPGIRPAPAEPPEKSDELDPRLAPLAALKSRLAAREAAGPKSKKKPKKE